MQDIKHSSDHIPSTEANLYNTDFLCTLVKHSFSSIKMFSEIIQA